MHIQKAIIRLIGILVILSVLLLIGIIWDFSFFKLKLLASFLVVILTLMIFSDFMYEDDDEQLQQLVKDASLYLKEREDNPVDLASSIKDFKKKQKPCQ